MSKKVLSVGQCSYDHGTISGVLSRTFGVNVVPADSLDSALAELRQGEYSLVLVNRLLDADHSEGLEVIRSLKSDRQVASLPMMLVSNLPDAQASAVEAGALPGFGKADLKTDQSLERLRAVLG